MAVLFSADGRFCYTIPATLSHSNEWEGENGAVALSAVPVYHQETTGPRERERERERERDTTIN